MFKVDLAIFVPIALQRNLLVKLKVLERYKIQKPLKNSMILEFKNCVLLHGVHLKYLCDFFSESSTILKFI